VIHFRRCFHCINQHLRWGRAVKSLSIRMTQVLWQFWVAVNYNTHYLLGIEPTSEWQSSYQFFSAKSWITNQYPQSNQQSHHLILFTHRSADKMSVKWLYTTHQWWWGEVPVIIGYITIAIGGCSTLLYPNLWGLSPLLRSGILWKLNIVT